MAINPGADLISEALMAAEPQRARAAQERLSQLAAADSPDTASFEALLSEPGSLDAAPSPLADGPMRMSNSGLFSVKRGNVYEQLEVTVLKTLFEAMLPEKANAVFGKGFAGGVWKSMLAQSLADVAGHAGVVGIARKFEERAKKKQSSA
jgi:peptidoglycan hydrolase FlgJ